MSTSQGGPFFQSDYGTRGNFELLVTNNQSSSSSGVNSGDVLHLFRNNDHDARWVRAGFLTRVDDAGSPEQSPVPFPVPRERAYRWPLFFEGTDRKFHGIAVQGTQAKYFFRPVPPNYGVPPAPAGPPACTGAPGFAQSSYGRNGNFELVIPVDGGGLDHYWANNDAGLPNRDASGRLVNMPAWQRLAHFGRGNRVHSARLIQTDFGNLEVIAREATSATATELVHYWKNGATGQWNFGSVLAGSAESTGIPGFCQSSFGRADTGHGNLEVVAPSRNGGLMVWYRVVGRGFDRAPDVDPGGRRLRDAHLMQSNYKSAGATHGNFEVVGETGSSPFGYGSLVFYFRDNGRRAWSGPFDLTF